MIRNKCFLICFIPSCQWRYYRVCNYFIISQFVTAIKSKPFILLAGISGTGKSRIVRQLAYATGGENPEKVQKPYNYEMISVHPNWHDSTELLGYVTRVSGNPEYIVTDFLKFIAKAWFYEGIPFFLCLDEMNLAPVEQYFAEYLTTKTISCFIHVHSSHYNQILRNRNTCIFELFF